ncbi:hypothetical protein [Nocardia sp. NPDC059239]|uniref:hypothetical protein n=1 Tax=unclassified Nocardia TaxID=2637762 RepID=UPI0036896537
MVVGALNRARTTRSRIDALLRKWLEPLPHSFTAVDQAAGYRYDLSVPRAEGGVTFPRFS